MCSWCDTVIRDRLSFAAWKGERTIQRAARAEMLGAQKKLLRDLATHLRDIVHEACA